MKPSLQLKLGNQLSMTPQLQQAIRLLQLSAIELQTEIQTALETNLMLESSEPELAPEEGSPEEKWHNTRLSSSFHETQGNELEVLNSTALSLQDHLRWQMQLTPFTETDTLIATILIDAINDDGFLSCSLPEIVSTVQQTREVDPAEVEAVLRRIQQFDPLGIGARDLRECLLLQLAHLSHTTPWHEKAVELVTHHLDLLGKRDYANLKRRLGLSSEALQQVIEYIQSLHPRPGTQIGDRTPEYIVPDIITYKKNGLWRVELNATCTPYLKINSHYAKLIRRADASTGNQFLRTQLQEARWFLKSVANRNETLLKVGQCIVEEQQDFLEYGEEAMKPLVLHHIAEALQMHESTISRITTQKYLYTPRGTFELKYFFSSHIATQEGECSATAIRAFIKKLIATENRQKPFSDHKLTQLLAKQGIPVARRTVAKYREAMTIPPSHERKQLF